MGDLNHYKSTPLIISRSEHPISRKNDKWRALKVLYRLHRHGFLAYLVGGSVRDLLLGKTPKDFDVATNAYLHEINASLKIAGLWPPVSFGSGFFLKVERSSKSSTFRSSFGEFEETQTEKGELIRKESFGTPKEDAFRRDITINGLFYKYRRFFHYRLHWWDGWPRAAGHSNDRWSRWKISTRSCPNDSGHPPCCPNRIPYWRPNLPSHHPTIGRRYGNVPLLVFETNFSEIWRKVRLKPLSADDPNRVALISFFQILKGFLESETLETQGSTIPLISIQPCRSMDSKWASHSQNRLSFPSFSCLFSGRSRLSISFSEKGAIHLLKNKPSSGRVHQILTPYSFPKGTKEMLPRS